MRWERDDSLLIAHRFLLFPCLGRQSHITTATSYMLHRSVYVKEIGQKDASLTIEKRAKASVDRAPFIPRSSSLDPRKCTPYEIGSGEWVQRYTAFDTTQA